MVPADFDAAVPASATPAALDLVASAAPLSPSSSLSLKPKLVHQRTSRRWRSPRPASPPGPESAPIEEPSGIDGHVSAGAAAAAAASLVTAAALVAVAAIAVAAIAVAAIASPRWTAGGSNPIGTDRGAAKSLLVPPAPRRAASDAGLPRAARVLPALPHNHSRGQPRPLLLRAAAGKRPLHLIDKKGAERSTRAGLVIWRDRPRDHSAARGVRRCARALPAHVALRR